MGWDETLFGWFYGRARALIEPRVRPEERAREATLEACRERLRVIGSALWEAPIEVLEAEDVGGFLGATLRLPATFRHAPTPEENEAAYRVRVAWSVTAMRLGLTFDAARPPIDRALATALAAPATRDALVEGCPGIASLLDAHEAHALVAAPPLPERPGAARALAALVARRLGASRSKEGGEGPPLTTEEDAWIARALEVRPADAASLEDCVDALGPSLRALGTRGADGFTAPMLWGWIGEPGDPTIADTAPGREPEALPTGTELVGKPREHVRRVELSEDPVQDNPAVHSFEKVHTAEEYRGGQKNADGSDELANHAEALRELDLREVVRSNERTASLLRCDVMIEGAAGDLADDGEPTEGIPYDEWNEKGRAYRPGWCRVRAGIVPARVHPSHAAERVAELRAASRRVTDAVRAELLRLELGRRWRSRQLDGPEIDEDAVVERIASLASGHRGSDRLYRARPRSAPELSVLLLVDASLSTDGWVANRRVLDVELESAVALGDALDGLDIELGIATFHSHTRRDCRFDVVKGMSEPWAAAQARIASIEPAGYTRIGPALRHATAVLERTASRRRLLLLLTDAKPNDYDRYEGSYGIADVRQAVREAERAGIHVHGLSVDPRARTHLPRMFGPSRHSAVSSPEKLPEALGWICSEMRV